MICDHMTTDLQPRHSGNWQCSCGVLVNLEEIIAKRTARILLLLTKKEPESRTVLWVVTSKADRTADTLLEGIFPSLSDAKKAIATYAQQHPERLFNICVRTLGEVFFNESKT